MSKPKGTKTRYGTRDLTNHLRELAAEAHDWTEEKGMITKGQALAELLWNRALGYNEKTISDAGVERVVKHEPLQWAIQLIYERLEGRATNFADEAKKKSGVRDKIDSMAKSRLNAIAQKSADTNTE